MAYCVLHKHGLASDSTRPKCCFVLDKDEGMVKIQFLSTGVKGGKEKKKTTRHNYITQK